jgi:hypothetical protein
MKFTRGQTIIELLLAMGFAVIFFPAIFTMFYVSREGKAQQIERTRASSLVIEIQEALRSIRERGWDELAQYVNDTLYHPAVGGGVWTLATGSEALNGFARSVTFSEVYRDAAGTIVSSGGTLDLSTRRATISVSWTTPLSASVVSVVYLTRHSNILIVDTTESDFNAGIHEFTKTVNLLGGEVVLSSTGGFGDWCTPTLNITALDLPKSGVANAISAIEGQIAAGTGENASGVSYANVSVTDPVYPADPAASIEGTFDGFKTNDVFTENDFAYLGTDTNAKEVEIISLAAPDVNGKYEEAGYFDAPGNGNADGVVTSGDVGYMVGGTKLYTFDLTSKSGSRPILDPDGLTLPGAGRKLKVVGARAFIATAATSGQLTIVDVSNPSSLSIIDAVALPAQGATDIYVNPTGTRAYVVTGTSATQREFFIINTETGSAEYKQILSSYDTNGMDPKGVVVVSGPRAILVGHGAEEYQVLNITDEKANPLPRCGGLEVASGVNGIDTVFTTNKRAYSYIITGDATTELKIIEGGPGAIGGEYNLTGIFTSRIFDISALTGGSPEAAFNRISATIVKPSSITDVTLKVAVADAVGGSCDAATYVFVGPDGTEGSSFTSADGSTIAGAIPFATSGSYVNPARCVRYRATLMTQDSTLTPQMLDVTVSYSP